VIDLVLDPPGQERERLDQPLDVWVGAAIGLQQEAARRRRVEPGELLRELADERQLALVIRIQGLAHRSGPPTRWIVASPGVIFRRATKPTSGEGSSRSVARISKSSRRGWSDPDFSGIARTSVSLGSKVEIASSIAAQTRRSASGPPDS